MAKERREHRIALEILYAVDVGGRPLDDAMAQARDETGVFGRGDRARAEDRYEPVYPAIDKRADTPVATDWTLVESIVRGTLACKPELEAQIAPLLQRWTVERLAGVDRMILLMSAWELRHREEAEATATINHAVELARRLSTDRSASFVNGVLDTLAKTPALDLPVPPGDAR
jgi:N utilization substance protein B